MNAEHAVKITEIILYKMKTTLNIGEIDEMIREAAKKGSYMITVRLSDLVVEHYLEQGFELRLAHKYEKDFVYEVRWS